MATAHSGERIEWSAASARDLILRLSSEQRTKQYVADLAMNGFGSVYLNLKPRQYNLPILAPSTLQENVWRLDPAVMVPQDRDWLFINMPLRPSFFINTNLIAPGDEPRSYRDLLDPQWAGKIVLQSPATGGSGSGWFRATYAALGLDYMRKLAKQVVLVPKVNDVPQAVVRGQYPIGLAASPTRGRQLVEEGAPVRFVQPKEGAHLAAQGIYLIANTPHPNAAKLFLHWFFSKEGQTVYARNTLVISVRKDVPQEYLPEDERYTEGEPFLMQDPQDVSRTRLQELGKLAREIFEGQSK